MRLLNPFESNSKLRRARGPSYRRYVKFCVHEDRTLANVASFTNEVHHMGRA
jgi:hypothetical protein